MNYLYGKINFGNDKKNRSDTSNEFDNNQLQLSVKRPNNFDFDLASVFYNKKTGVICAIFGYISNLDEIKNNYEVNKKNVYKELNKILNLKTVKLKNIDTRDQYSTYSVAINSETHHFPQCTKYLLDLMMDIQLLR